MANTNIDYTSNGGKVIPKPIVQLGNNFILQHYLQTDINSFINFSYTSSNRNSVNSSLTQSGVDWANNNLYVSLSYAKNYSENYEDWLTNTPMIFMEVYNSKGTRSNRNIRYAKPYFSHPVNNTGPINRINSNYGSGDSSSLETEWNFTPVNPFQEQIIEINPKNFYRNSGIAGITLPIRWVDFVFDSGNQLKYQRTSYRTLTNGNPVINTFVQPIRFRFGCLGEDSRSVLLGDPSDTLFISPKWGEFNDNDTYIYDWQIRFHK